MTLPVVILMGGLATRLQPITKKIPKALVDIAGKPFIARQLDYLRQQGIERVVLCIGYLGEQVKDVVGNGSSYGIKVSYSWDGPNLLGTGGAIKKALPLIGEQFFVYNGDTYLPIDFHEVERSFFISNKPALMTVSKNNNQWDKSNVLFLDGRIIEYNKQIAKSDMMHIDYGLGILTASVLDNTPDNEPFDLADVYHNLSVAEQLASFEVHGRLYEIGSHKGLKETINMFKKGFEI